MDQMNRKAQNGEGNFFRGFMEYMVNIANEKGVFTKWKHVLCKIKLIAPH